jgi:hypothetical protein
MGAFGLAFRVLDDLDVRLSCLVPFSSWPFVQGYFDVVTSDERLSVRSPKSLRDVLAATLA